MSVFVKSGGGENVTPEVQAQSPLVTEILESLVGKVTLANATPETILEGYSAYVGQQLVEGTLPTEKVKIDYGTFTASSATNITINHSLKMEPSYVMMLPKSLSSDANIFLMNFTGTVPFMGNSYFQLITYVSGSVMYAERRKNESAYQVTYNRSSITFRTSSPSSLKGTYLWIAIA